VKVNTKMGSSSAEYKGGNKPQEQSDREFFGPCFEFIAEHTLFKVPGNGDCFFSSFNHLRRIGISRKAVADHMRKHIEFYGFLSGFQFRSSWQSFPSRDQVALENLSKRSNPDMLREWFLKFYCGAIEVSAADSEVRHGSWASDREIQAVSEMIFKSDGQVVVVIPTANTHQGRGKPSLFVSRKCYNAHLDQISVTEHPKTGKRTFRYNSHGEDRECIVLKHEPGHFDRVLPAAPRAAGMLLAFICTKLHVKGYFVIVTPHR
jgi:hypothetical protein